MRDKSNTEAHWIGDNWLRSDRLCLTGGRRKRKNLKKKGGGDRYSSIIMERKKSEEIWGGGAEILIDDENAIKTGEGAEILTEGLELEVYRYLTLQVLFSRKG